MSQPRLLPSCNCPDNILWNMKIMKMLCHFIHFPAVKNHISTLKLDRKLFMKTHTLECLYIYIYMYIIPDSVLVVILQMLSTTFTYLYNFISAISFKVISRTFLVTSQSAVIFCADNF